MTFDEGYVILDVMTDKSGTSYFTPDEKKVMLKQGTYNYLEAISDNFESDLTLTDGLYPIVVGPTVLSVNADVATLPTDFMFRLNCYLNSPENEIRYQKLNNWSHTHDDPHAKPIDEDISYTLTSAGALFSGYSSGTVNMFYMKKPEFAPQDNIGEWVNLPEQEQYKIIEHSFKLATSSMNDENRFPFALNMLQDKKE